MQVLAKRLLTRPLIDSRMDAHLEGNVNGPSLIKMPAWLKSRKAKYHLYFSHHCGDHIRLAFANKLTGPWTVYVGGVLRLSETPFVQQKPNVPEPKWAVDRGISGLYPHIASPDVHIDHQRSELKMYFHGLDQDGEQRSLTATSKDGLTWKVHLKRIEQTYLRVFRYESKTYAIALGGEVLRETKNGLFQTGGWIFPTEHRHSAVLVKGNILHVIWSRVGDAPESLLHSIIDLNQPWKRWAISQTKIILKPELIWEGSNYPIRKSDLGMARSDECALRDPCIFQTEHKTYLIYTGAGEAALGIAELFGV